MNLQIAVVARNKAHDHLRRQIQQTIEFLALHGYGVESRGLHEAYHDMTAATIAVQDQILVDARVLDARAASTEALAKMRPAAPRMTMVPRKPPVTTSNYSTGNTFVCSLPKARNTRHTSNRRPTGQMIS